MLIVFSRYNRKKQTLNLKGYGKDTVEMLMTIYAMAHKVKTYNSQFKTVKEVFKKCLELDNMIDKVEEF